MLETFPKPLRMCVSVFLLFCLLFHVHCMQSPIQHVMIYYTYWRFNAYWCILYIFIVLMHINFFRTSFAQKTCITAPYLHCQRMYCVQCCLIANWRRYICMKVTNIPVTRTWLVRPWNLPRCPAAMDGDQRLMLYWIDPVDAADRRAANLNWLKLFTFTSKGRSRSKDQRNEHLVVQFRIGIPGSPAHRFA